MRTPAQARQLERLFQRYVVSVPELIRTALRQHGGLPTESDRQPGCTTRGGHKRMTRGPVLGMKRNSAPGEVRQWQIGPDGSFARGPSGKLK